MEQWSNLHVELHFHQKLPFAAITALDIVLIIFLQIFRCDFIPGLLQHFPETQSHKVHCLCMLVHCFFTFVNLNRGFFSWQLFR